MTGEQRSGFDAERRAAGPPEETWTIQHTPMGAFMLVWFECDSVEAAFGNLATGQDDFTVWMRGQILACTGVDMSVPDELAAVGAACSTGARDRRFLPDPAGHRARLDRRPTPRRVLPAAARPGLPTRSRGAGVGCTRPGGPGLAGAAGPVGPQLLAVQQVAEQPGDVADGSGAPAAPPRSHRSDRCRPRAPAPTGARPRRPDAARPQRRSRRTIAGLRRPVGPPVLHLRRPISDIGVAATGGVG